MTFAREVVDERDARSTLTMLAPAGLGARAQLRARRAADPRPSGQVRVKGQGFWQAMLPEESIWGDLGILV